MTTTTGTRYEVGIKNSHSSFSPDGRKKSWSKTYDLQDCYNHIAELREHVYDGKKPYEHSVFVIRINTTVTTEFEVKP